MIIGFVCVLPLTSSLVLTDNPHHPAEMETADSLILKQLQGLSKFQDVLAIEYEKMRKELRDGPIENDDDPKMYEVVRTAMRRAQI